MSGVKAILFDKDGTLIDFRSTWLAAYRGAAAELAQMAGSPGLDRELLRRQGYDPQADEFSSESPLLWATSAEIARSWADMSELAHVGDTLARVERHFHDSERYPPRAVGDLPPLFDRLRERGLKLGIATMDSERKAHATAGLLGIDGHLDFVAGADSGFGEKPEPGMVHAFCERVGVAPGSVLTVGDTHADMGMARGAGCAMAVAVLTGGMQESELAPLADRVLSSVMEIESVL